MALPRHRNSSYHTIFPLGDTSISLPNDIIKSYLPTLWRYYGRRALAKGYLDLEGLRIVQGPCCRTALSVLLRALEFSEAGHGVSSELKKQLDRSLTVHANHHQLPELAMSKIFRNVAILVYKTGQNKEMTYAMAEWFAVFAAEHRIRTQGLVNYITALDKLGADMKGPLHTLLRETRLRSSHVETICGKLRPSTRKSLRRLWRDQNRLHQPRRAILPPREDLIEGGDLCTRDIIRIHQDDPDSIVVRLGPRHRIPRDDFETDDDYSTDTDTDTSDDDDDYCTNPDCWARVHDPSSFHPFNGLPFVPHHVNGLAPIMPPPPRHFGSPLMGAAHPGLTMARPPLRRGFSLPAAHVGGFLKAPVV
ncbi:MAG: hypothetical protein LQ337_001357 [Flavoplaca oasis]|nr:MAG: hypothetical protein LQ337_001357 [Flavoplaca oasis]